MPNTSAQARREAEVHYEEDGHVTFLRGKKHGTQVIKKKYNVSETSTDN